MPIPVWRTGPGGTRRAGPQASTAPSNSVCRCRRRGSRAAPRWR